MPAPRFQRAGRICQGLSAHPDRVGSGEGAGVRPQGIHSHLKTSLKKNFFFKNQFKRKQVPVLFGLPT